MMTVGVVNNLFRFRNRLPEGNLAKRFHDKRNITPGIQVTFPGGQMTHGGSNAVSVYSADQKAVIKAFGSMEKDALYLFFVEQVKGKDGDIGGYMPLQRQAGFIYDLPNNELIAHELAHGAFRDKK
jgi:hypothetical protein